MFGACPLQHTDVDADIAGYITRVHVRQTFTNPLDRKIEAVYVFPLPQDSAVDDMVMIIGDRRIVGKVQEKKLARKTYDERQIRRTCRQSARSGAAQHLHAVGGQHRTGSAGSHRHKLCGDAEVRGRRFTFVFPMVVGPRYMPGSPNGKVAPEQIKTRRESPTLLRLAL